METAKKVKVTIAVGVVVLAAVLAVTLTRSPPRVVRVGEGSGGGLLAATDGSGEACQANELLPAHVSAIRLSIVAYVGAGVRVRAYSGSRVVAEGTRGPEWTGTSVTVPVKPLRTSVANARLCVTIEQNSEAIYFFGVTTPARDAAVTATGERLTGRVGVEYLASGTGSWWSRILTVARHMGLGRAFSGTWIVLVIAALMAAVGLLAVRVTMRELPDER
jgi:hypothetical protein